MPPDERDLGHQPFGSMLRLHREEAGLSQEELARSASISVATLRDLEQLRSRRPRISTVRALTAALGVSGVQAHQLPSESQVPDDESHTTCWTTPSETA